MYEHTAVPTGNLNQRWSHGIWVGEAPMTDERIVLTENEVQKAKSLHHVTSKEKFLISELEKAREFSWNDVADAPGSRFIWTSADASDDRNRDEDWSNTWMQRLCRIEISRGSMSGAIAKNIS